MPSSCRYLGGQIATALSQRDVLPADAAVGHAPRNASALRAELHDAVSPDPVFGEYLCRDDAPVAPQRNPDEAWKHFPQLQRLVRGALGEMRSLLHELRLSALAMADLATLMGHLIDAEPLAREPKALQRSRSGMCQCCRQM